MGGQDLSRTDDGVRCVMSGQRRRCWLIDREERSEHDAARLGLDCIAVRFPHFHPSMHARLHSPPALPPQSASHSDDSTMGDGEKEARPQAPRPRSDSQKNLQSLQPRRRDVVPAGGAEQAAGLISLSVWAGE